MRVSDVTVPFEFLQSAAFLRIQNMPLVAVIRNSSSAYRHRIVNLAV
jgi:hypothetical protein